ncbi:MAG: hypothetical protein U0Q07_06815 [Acidimicrobiales bacterium]
MRRNPRRAPQIRASRSARSRRSARHGRSRLAHPFVVVATLVALVGLARPALAAPPASAGSAPAGASATCAADLGVTSFVQTYAPQPRVLYVRVDVTNHGPCTVAAARASGYVPAGTTLGQTLSVGAGTADATTWSIGALASGATVELQVLVVVPLSFGSANATGTVHATSEVPDLNPANNAAPYSEVVEPLVRTGGFHPLTAARILDTRNGTNTTAAPMGAATTRTVPMLGHGGVPASGVDSVVVNVTVTQPTAGSHLTVWPTGQDRPTASSLNFSAGQTVANAVTVKLGTGGSFSVFNNSGSVHVLADVVGWYSSVPGDGVGYIPVTPTRFYDSRTAGVPFYPGQDVRFPLGAGFSGSAVALNVTVTGALGTSHLRVWPDGKPMPTASSLNFDAGDTRANLVVVGLGGVDHAFHIYNNSSYVQVVVDIVGVYDVDGTKGGGYHGVTPYRVLDTRSGVGAPAAKVGPGASIDLLVAGQGGVPGWAQTVIVNVTSVWPSAITHQTIWPTGLAMPLASSLNNEPGDIRPNLVMARVGYGGKISIYNSSGSVDLIGDIVGWTG